MTNEEIVSEIKKGNDKKANLEYLYKSNIPLIRQIVKPYANENNFDDLMMCAFIGICAAVPGFDETKGTFFTYAPYYIRRECMNFLRLNEMPFVVPYNLNEKISKYKKGVANLEQELKRHPTEKEIADYTGLSVAQIEDVQRVLSPVVSLESPCGEDESGTISDILSDGRDVADEVTDSLNQANQRLSLWEYVEDALSDRQFDILRMRFLDGRSVREIADKYGISQQRVCAIEKRAFQKLLKDHESAAFLAAEIESLGYANYSGVGLGIFRRRWASSVEVAVLRRERKKRRFSGMIEDAERANRRFDCLVKENGIVDKC